MDTAPAFGSVGEALDMVRAGLGYLAAAADGGCGVPELAQSI